MYRFKYSFLFVLNWTLFKIKQLTASPIFFKCVYIIAVLPVIASQNNHTKIHIFHTTTYINPYFIFKKSRSPTHRIVIFCTTKEQKKTSSRFDQVITIPGQFQQEKLRVELHERFFCVKVFCMFTLLWFPIGRYKISSLCEAELISPNQQKTRKTLKIKIITWKNISCTLIHRFETTASTILFPHLPIPFFPFFFFSWKNKEMV